jgi:nicotinate-nucleotide adenylyltransferase
MARRVALLGGSFNPPHVAHQMIALWVLSTEQADEVWLMPCFRHPFGKGLVDFRHRIEMCRRAALALPPGRVQVSAVEEELGGESRTLLTVQHLLATHPDCQLRLVIGADILQEKASWYRFDELARLAPPLVIGRSGYPSPASVPELPAVSSSRIRELLLRGEDVSAWLPAPVLEYIRAEGLYGHG